MPILTSTSYMTSSFASRYKWLTYVAHGGSTQFVAYKSTGPTPSSDDVHIERLMSFCLILLGPGFYNANIALVLPGTGSVPELYLLHVLVLLTKKSFLQ